MIEIKEVVKDFDGFRALDGLNMRIEDGCIYGLVGPNGAGKSTVIRHIMGVYKATEGQVLVDGESSYENPNVKQKTFYIPDELFCFGNCSVEEMGKFFLLRLLLCPWRFCCACWGACANVTSRSPS